MQNIHIYVFCPARLLYRFSYVLVSVRPDPEDTGIRDGHDLFEVCIEGVIFALTAAAST